MATSETGAGEAQQKRRRNRSPRYPTFDLGTAIERITEFYQSSWNHSIGVEAACEVWELSYSSSTGKRTLSALTQFGLLVYEGKGDSRLVKLSQWALDIVTDPPGVTGAPDTAIRQAALAPEVYRRTWERWGPRLPSDDRTITPWIIKDLEFNPNSTVSFLEDFRATVQFARLDNTTPTNENESNGGTDVEGHSDSDKHDGPLDDDQSRKKARGPMMDAATESDTAKSKPEVQDFTIPLRGAGVAVLSVPVPLSDHNFTQLEQWLKWAQDSLVYHGEDDG